ncbi:MAG: protein kinase, partial [Pseudomonadota bacterium]
MPDPSEGLLLCNRFILRRRLGQGGMGEVWLASDKALEDQVALKILKPSLAVSADGIRLLREECRHSRRLTHPSIVRIYDFHSHETHHFISMEYVPGTDFRRFVGSPPMECLPKLLPVIDALEYSHAQGFIHRDIKTSNIL